MISDQPITTDKIEDEKYKAKIKAQIEIDKRERAERTAREKALREGRPIVDNMADQAAVPTPAAAPVAAPITVAGKDYKETRLQIRLASGGQPLVTTLPSDARKLIFLSLLLNKKGAHVNISKRYKQLRSLLRVKVWALTLTQSHSHRISRG